jgi:hypothetical protein
MLDEAIAKLDEELSSTPLLIYTEEGTAMAWGQKVLAIRAAVYEVALAAVHECWRDCPTLAMAEEKLDRQFGLPEGSGTP